MSTTITPKPNLLPDGTAVALYLRTDVELERQTGAAPLKAPVAKGVMAEGKFVTNASLSAATGYVLIGWVDEVQKVTVKAKKGKFKLKLEGQETAGLKYNATAAEVKEGLEALPNVAAGDVEVSGGPGNESGSAPYLITFRQAWAGTNVAQMTADVTELEETPKTVEVATVTEGSKAGEGGVQKACLYTTDPA